ncbi:MAG: NFYB/HAP3 family transcription factor subunit [Candidatus Heimdallarchaeota archaeon]|nr:NFYB/HAP3 family transcription factor subunit [Candidatus Heimdallarchaeota archaeon]
MPKKKGKSLRLAFTTQECKRIIKKAGIERVSPSAAVALNKLLTHHAREVAAGAVTISMEKNRKTVTSDDITKAVRMGSSIASYVVDKQAPVVHNVWFISSGGTCLLSRSYSGLKFPDTIFAGLVTGIFDLMGEVTGRPIDRIVTDELIIHVRRIGEVTVAIICDSENSEPIDELTDLLAKRFSDVFAEEVEVDVIDTSVFEDFSPVLDALVSGVGLSIPKERLKVLRKQTTLTDRQLEETVDATSLREELRRAQERIQDFDLFRKNQDDEKAPTVDIRLDEPPEVSEIKAVLRQATIDIRDNYQGKSSTPDEAEEPQEEITPEEIQQEVANDLTKITQKKKVVKKKRKKRKKRTRKK